jgi:signal transduction histidine kinase
LIPVEDANRQADPEAERVVILDPLIVVRDRVHSRWQAAVAVDLVHLRLDARQDLVRVQRLQHHHGAVDDIVVVVPPGLTESGQMAHGHGRQLYDATAEANGVTLIVDVVGGPTTLGDKALLASATANLLDNALKYGGSATTVRVEPREDRQTVSIIVQDQGPGIPPEERTKVVARFYRLDWSRGLYGNGLGLAIVTAISHLHGGRLCLEEGAPGLIARIELRRTAA